MRFHLGPFLLFSVLLCAPSLSHASRAAAERVFLEGHELFARGEFEAAASLFQQAIRHDPEHLSARNYLKEVTFLLLKFQGAASPPMSDLDAAAPPAAAAEPGQQPSTALEAGASASPGSPSSDLSTASAEHGSRAPPPQGRSPSSTAPAKRRTDPRNPRSRGGAALGLGLFGPSLGLGGVVQARPHWLVAIGAGLGGLMVIRGDQESGAFGLFIEAQLLPVPWRLTPLVGVGLTLVVGSLAEEVDERGYASLADGTGRLLPYLSLGLRYDAPSGFWASGGLGLVPAIVLRSGVAIPSVLPIPGFRIGVRL